jgi:hypothetical protein
MIIDLDSWEAGYEDGLRGRPSQCTTDLDGCRIRAATSRLKVVRGRRKTVGFRQPNQSLNGMVVALG